MNVILYVGGGIVGSASAAVAQMERHVLCFLSLLVLANLSVTTARSSRNARAMGWMTLETGVRTLPASGQRKSKKCRRAALHFCFQVR
jgi:hypothetical protein